MKKNILLILILILCISFTACAIKNISVPEPEKGSVLPSESSSPTAEPKPSPEATTKPTPAPAPTPTPYAGLKHGDENEDVKVLQLRLKELGYLKANATGYFGSKTEAAVNRFLKECALEQTGTATDEMQKILYSESAPACPLALYGCIIGVDPGHQAKANHDREPVAPGSDEVKSKVSSGTQGRFTGVAEYRVNMQVGLILKEMLEAEGAEVIMTRLTDDVDISNAERAQLFNENKTDYAIRLHCNGKDDQSVHGAFILVPTKNPYIEDCDIAAEILIEEYCKETGAKNLGITTRSDQTGFNWCERMIVNIEMGHMTNEQEDHRLTDPEYQQKMARGITNGIIKYFEQKNS